ncbi:FkbM family methyltransferase [Rhizobium deserti]|uniref:FkbM family methyltransferase n=1 Tax=Rhizobium deserti TaxID=2547961 RepID=A0A4R5UIR0_9HYPH|nr:FkbM family methyltransferase [Rhizobium deserti]TDK36609.1 FkbM family methyltransferase [Rhizobium deserti]
MSSFSFKQQLDSLHFALFGWPTDHLTPLSQLEACGDIREAAILLLNSDRFRWDIRDKVPLFAEEKWVCTEYMGLRIWVNLHDSQVSFGVLHQDWEVREAHFMTDMLNSGDTMLDIGANVGVYTLQAARAVGSTGEIHSFEPNPTVNRMLRRSITDNGFQDICVVHEVGLADADTPGSLHHLTGTNNVGAAYVSKSAGAGISISLRRLDSFTFERRINFMKIDVEGYECQVLEGGSKLLGEHRPLVLAELFPCGLRNTGGRSARELVARWTDLQYKVEEFEHGRLGRVINHSNIDDYEDIVDPINVLCTPT